MRSGDDVGGDDLAEGSSGALASFDGGFYRGDVAADDDRLVGGSDLLLADEFDVGGLEHCVGGFEDGGQSLGFEDAEGFGGVLHDGFEIRLMVGGTEFVVATVEFVGREWPGVQRGNRFVGIG